MSAQTPLVSAVTKWLGLRRNKMWLRYKDDMSPRTIPKPNLPPGSSEKLSNNYYYTRDSRRQISTPTIIASQIQPFQTALQAGEGDVTTQSESKIITSDGFPTPGFQTRWTLSSDEPYLRR